MPEIVLKLGSKNVSCLVDTGSSRTIIKKHLLPKSTKIFNCKNRLTGVNNTNVPLLGEALVQFSSQKYSDPIISTVLVVPNSVQLPFPCIIGADICSKYNVKIDFEKKSVLFEDKNCHISQNNNNDIHVHAIEEFVVPANSASVVNAKVSKDGVYVIKKNTVCGLLIGESICQTKNRLLPILLLNPKNSNVKISKNKILSQAEKFSNNEQCYLLQENLLNANVDSSTFKDHSDLNKQCKPQKLEPITSDMINSTLNSNDKQRLLAMLNRNRQAIALRDESPGLRDIITHDIRVQPDVKPLYVKQYRTLRRYKEILDSLVDDMLKHGIIRRSTSPWNFPVILVKKKDNSFRVAVDFRRLNEITIPFKIMMPKIDELISQLKGAEIFSTLDIVSAFWHIKLSDDAAKKTSFTTRKGKFEFTSLCFGLVDSPAVFNSMLSHVLMDIIGFGVLVYLDDIIVYSKNFTEHINKIDQLLKIFGNAGLKIKLQKCSFGQEQVKFLGHTVSKHGIEMDRSKDSVIRLYPVLSR